MNGLLGPQACQAPDRPFYNSKALRSGDLQILCNPVRRILKLKSRERVGREFDNMISAFIICFILKHKEISLDVSTISRIFPTEHFTLPVPQNPSIGKFFALQNRRSTLFVTQLLRNVRSCCLVIELIISLLERYSHPTSKIPDAQRPSLQPRPASLPCRHFRWLWPQPREQNIRNPCQNDLIWRKHNLSVVKRPRF